MKKRTAFSCCLVALGAMAHADLFHDYENLSEGFLGTTYSQDGLVYRDVNNVTGVDLDGSPFGPGDLGDQLVLENATFFYNDFPTYGSPINALTFGNAFVVGDNLSIGALSSVFMDYASLGIAASLDLAFYENGPWGGVEYRLEALRNGNVVASDSFLIADGGGRDNATFRTMSVSGAEFDSLHLFAIKNGEFTNPRGMIDNLSITSAPVPEPGTLAVLGIGALAFLRRRKTTAK